MPKKDIHQMMYYVCFQYLSPKVLRSRLIWCLRLGCKEPDYGGLYTGNLKGPQISGYEKISWVLHSLEIADLEDRPNSSVRGQRISFSCLLLDCGLSTIYVRIWENGCDGYRHREKYLRSGVNYEDRFVYCIRSCVTPRKIEIVST